MNTQELRSGNYLHSLLTGNNFAATVYDIVNILEGGNVIPITLTKDWLYKLSGNCEIEKISEPIFKIDRFKLIWRPKYKYWYVMDELTGVYMSKVEHVHEWQNFYRYMNGEELIIKL